MIISFYFICVSAVLINKVSLQITGFIGGSVVLPCPSTQHDFNPQDTEVHWRHNGSKIVFDIIKGKASVDQQDPRYKKRVETLHSDYNQRRNFNIRLTDLNHTDAGKYSCLISHSSEHKTVELIINETITEYGTKSPTTEIGTKSADQENQKLETSSSLLWVYIGVPALLIMIIAGFIVGCRKKIQAALFSPVMTEDKEQRQK